MQIHSLKPLQNLSYPLNIDLTIFIIPALKGNDRGAVLTFLHLLDFFDESVSGLAEFFTKGGVSWLR